MLNWLSHLNALIEYFLNGYITIHWKNIICSNRQLFEYKLIWDTEILITILVAIKKYCIIYQLKFFQLPQSQIKLSQFSNLYILNLYFLKMNLNFQKSEFINSLQHLIRQNLWQMKWKTNTMVIIGFQYFFEIFSLKQRR